MPDSGVSKRVRRASAFFPRSFQRPPSNSCKPSFHHPLLSVATTRQRNTAVLESTSASCAGGRRPTLRRGHRREAAPKLLAQFPQSRDERRTQRLGNPAGGQHNRIECASLAAACAERLLVFCGLVVTTLRACVCGGWPLHLTPKPKFGCGLSVSAPKRVGAQGGKAAAHLVMQGSPRPLALWGDRRLARAQDALTHSGQQGRR